MALPLYCISIPYGAIKSQSYVDMMKYNAQFQFLMVRLKVRQAGKCAR